MNPKPLRWILRLSLASLGLCAAGCDPSINLYGSFFPAWTWCLALGVMLSGLSHWVLSAARLERHLGPLVLVYPALTLLFSCLTWLVLFR